MSSDTIYTLADLDNWSFAGTALAVLGHPIKHSISPPMHNAALAEMAKRDPRFATWKYFRFDVHPDDLPEALDKFHARGFHGLNLTVPHKIIAFERIKKDVVVSALPIGAVNTLLRTESDWQGHNTDGHGLSHGIKEDLGLMLGEQSEALLLGAGGAARGAAVECIRCRVRSLAIVNRTAATRDALIESIAALAAKAEVPLRGLDPALLPKNLPHDVLVINATSAGLKPTDPPPIDLASIPRPAAVYDMIYNPPETRLLAQARALGVPSANGLSMLVHQGARALEIWSGASVPVETMRAAATAALAQH